MRGTNQTQIQQSKMLQGSPPLARDKSCKIESFPLSIGITPACAGQIRYKRYAQRCRQDHPRLRGTNNASKNVTRYTLGSPPLARDKLLSKILNNSFTGITPACAGQICEYSPVIFIRQDHPRLRGTNIDTVKSIKQCPGSPPLARDK